MRLSFVLRIHTVLWKLCIPDSILKSRDITVPTKVHLVKSYGFASSHIRMWELDYKSWVPKNWCFWTVVLQKTLESPLDSKEVHPVNLKGNQSWIFIGRTDVELQHFGHQMRRADSLGKTLMLGKIEGRRRRRWQRMRWWDGITDSMDMSLRELWEWWPGRPGVLQSMGLQRVGHD